MSAGGGSPRGLAGARGERPGDGAELARLRDIATGRAAWRRWGPYLSERAWGTVREDYSRTGEPTSSFPHDHARSRVYRWAEDGLGGICDDAQRLCFAFAFWNGRDPILKERIFGTGDDAAGGVDAKELWWYADATPTYSWMRWRYAYPQSAFPYAELTEQPRPGAPELHLADTGVFDAGYWDITADYAKAAEDDVLIRLLVRNAGHVQATIDVLPTFWFRNTWSWGTDEHRPGLREEGSTLVAEHRQLGRWVLTLAGEPDLLFCENESNTQRLWGMPSRYRCPKDGINDYVVHGAPTVNTERTGTKAAARYRLTVPAGGGAELRLRLAADRRELSEEFAGIMRRREAEADGFYASRLPDGLDAEEALVARQAFAGLLWSRQRYLYDVGRWLEGDPAGAPPPPERWHGRNARWRHVEADDVVLVPDPWRYPWLVAWEQAFHAVAMASVDAGGAKEQLLLLLQSRYMHPGGQLPDQEWDFACTAPPLHAWAAMRIFEMDGRRDPAFLARVLHKLLLNFTWWVQRTDGEGDNVFESGFVGVDGIGPFDVAGMAGPIGAVEHADGALWMAFYCTGMLDMAIALAAEDPTYEDLAVTFFEHYTRIALALDDLGLWDEDEGFYYDLLRLGDGTRLPLMARSALGLLPACAVTILPAEVRDRLPTLAHRMDVTLGTRPRLRQVIGHAAALGRRDSYLLSIVSPADLRRTLSAVLDEGELLSRYGVRTLSRGHRDHPLGFRLGETTARIDYEPGDATAWRGAVWPALTVLLQDALRRYHEHLGADFTVECPAGSGARLPLDAIADELGRRLASAFLPDPDGRRPVHGGRPVLDARAWRDRVLFPEMLHGDDGRGLGSSHHTGWTALVGTVLAERPAPPDPDESPLR